MPVSELGGILPKGKLADVLERIVTNAHRVDIHFFPGDDVDSGFSIMEKNSVALFRYPISVPVQVLNAAKYSTEDAWAVRRENLAIEFPMAASFERWPIKVAKLKGGFLSDMVSRYLAMYIRFGSDDFSDETIEEIGKKIMGGK